MRQQLPILLMSQMELVSRSSQEPPNNQGMGLAMLQDWGMGREGGSASGRGGRQLLMGGMRSASGGDFSFPPPTR